MLDWIALATNWLQSWMSAEAGLWGLLVSAIASATVLPGSSELVLTAVVAAYPALMWPAFFVAWAGNVLGSALTYGMGHAGQAGYARFQRVRSQIHLEHPRIQSLKRKGPPVLILAFVPLVGDALVLAAGWLRLPFWPSLAWIAAGKAARYAILLLGLKGLLSLA